MRGVRAGACDMSRSGTVLRHGCFSVGLVGWVETQPERAAAFSGLGLDPAYKGDPKLRP